MLDGGPAENTTIALGTLSGTPRNQRDLSFESSTNRMVVRFRADQSIQARGFQATWRAGQFINEKIVNLHFLSVRDLRWAYESPGNGPTTPQSGMAQNIPEWHGMRLAN